MANIGGGSVSGWPVTGDQSEVYSDVADHGPIPEQDFCNAWRRISKDGTNFASRLVAHLVVTAVPSPGRLGPNIPKIHIAVENGDKGESLRRRRSYTINVPLLLLCPES
jgi:hypothetical protein